MEDEVTQLTEEESKRFAQALRDPPKTNKRLKRVASGLNIVVFTFGRESRPKYCSAPVGVEVDEYESAEEYAEKFPEKVERARERGKHTVLYDTPQSWRVVISYLSKELFYYMKEKYNLIDIEDNVQEIDLLEWY